MIKRLNISIILLFFACGPPPAKTLILGYDTNSTRDYLITVVDAVNSYAGCQVLDIDNSNFNIRTVFVYEQSDIEAYGFYELKNDHIAYRLSAFLQEDRALHTMTHEIGHALGLKHSADSNRLMYRFLVDPMHVDIAAADMIEQWKETFPKDNICKTLKFKPNVKSFDDPEKDSDCEQK